MFHVHNFILIFILNLVKNEKPYFPLKFIQKGATPLEPSPVSFILDIQSSSNLAKILELFMDNRKFFSHRKMTPSTFAVSREKFSMIALIFIEFSFDRIIIALLPYLLGPFGQLTHLFSV